MMMLIKETLTKTTFNLVQIYFDLDGVFADFARGVSKIFPEFIEGKSDTDRKMDGRMWKAIRSYQKDGGEFWHDLEVMEGALTMWEYVRHHKPQILSACGDPSFGAEPQKRKWVAKHFGSATQVHLVRRAVDKAQFAKPGCLLIDDKLKAIDPWKAAGGTGILHTDPAKTITEMKALGI